MCLTGVDYFSTLGYQPGIAFLAAGLLSPVATAILVLVTLFGALPVYRRVAEASPNGQGSIGMLEKLFPQWSGKIFVLILLGFAATDFVITMTLSAADAANHFTQNPFTPGWMKSQMGVTLALLTLLSGIFLKGFKEAIGVAVTLVGLYLALNTVVTAVAIRDVLLHPRMLTDWKNALFMQHGNPLAMIGISVVLFPKLALGLSGFETGVAVMPLIQGEDLAGRIRNTRKLLVTAAVIMSVFLIATSVATTLLIPPEKAARPLVLVFMAVAFTVTILFRANVDAQGGAYATGVLILITSAACAVTLSLRGRWLRWPFGLIALVFVYATAMNIHERPEGLKIASIFIAVMIGVSVVSRVMRSTELRIDEVVLDAESIALLAEHEERAIRLIARRPHDETEADLDRVDREVRDQYGLPANERICFFEVELGDASEFQSTLHVTGSRAGKHYILRAKSPVIPNAIAALLIHLEKTTGKIPHGYFKWTEGNPTVNLIRFLFLGEGDTAPIVHEVLRRAIKDPKHRPVTHVS